MQTTAKIVLGNDIRRFALPEATTFEGLREMVRVGYRVDPVVIQFVDDEGDMCVIGSTGELAEARRLAGSNVLKLFVRTVAKRSAEVSGSKARTKAPRAKPEPKPEPKTKPEAVTEESKPEIVVLDSAKPMVEVKPKHGKEYSSYKDRPSAFFVADVNYPDYNVLKPGNICKTWSVKNDGTKPWPEGSKVSFVTGSLKSGEFKLPLAEAGETVDITIDIAIPASLGTHHAIFQLEDSQGKPFRNRFRLWLKCRVEPSLSQTEFLEQLKYWANDQDMKCQIDDVLIGEVVHHGVECDGCSQFPIKGARFKCATCPDYDLCEACEAKEIHPSGHILLKMKSQARHQWDYRGPRGPRFHGRRKPFGCKGLRWTDRGLHSMANDKVCEMVKDTVKATVGQTSKTCLHPKCRSSPHTNPKNNGGLYCCQRCKNMHWQGQEPKHGPACRSNPKKKLKKQLNSAFVADVTIPDGEVGLCGTTITKTWRLKNTGAAVWENVQLVHLDGPLGPTGPTFVTSTKAGETTNISARILLPATIGRMQGVYRLATKDGVKFGHRVWVDVDVQAPVKPQPSLNEVDEQPKKVAKLQLQKVTEVLQPDDVLLRPTAPAFKYEAKLAMLNGMGFKDEEQLKELLCAANGDISRVLSWICA